MFKKIIFFIGFICIIIIGINWQLVEYLAMQANGQFKVLADSQPLNYYLNQSDFPDSLKTRIVQLQQVKNYAIDQVHLPAEDQYNSIYDQKGEDILWVITASDAYQLISYEWSFPLLGKVNYKGFFIKSKAEETYTRLKAQGYDVHIRAVGAWSTLGWFNDPLLSNMLYRSHAQLAEVVFHELIHDVVYIKDSTDFNENLASFMARELTKKYMLYSNFTEEDKIEYQNALADHDLLYSFMNDFVTHADSMYADMRELSAKEKSVRKQQLFEKMRREFRDLSFTNEFMKARVLQNDSFNNAHLLAYKRYGGLNAVLRNQYQVVFHADILKMLNYYQDNFSNI